MPEFFTFRSIIYRVIYHLAIRKYLVGPKHFLRRDKKASSEKISLLALEILATFSFGKAVGLADRKWQF